MKPNDSQTWCWNPDRLFTFINLRIYCLTHFLPKIIYLILFTTINEGVQMSIYFQSCSFNLPRDNKHCILTQILKANYIIRFIAAKLVQKWVWIRLFIVKFWSRNQHEFEISFVKRILRYWFTLPEHRFSKILNG